MLCDAGPQQAPQASAACALSLPRLLLDRSCALAVFRYQGHATPTLLPSEPDGHFLKLPRHVAHFKLMVGLHGFEPRKSETPDLQSGADCHIYKNPKKLVRPRGFEPRFADRKSAVLTTRR